MLSLYIWNLIFIFFPSLSEEREEMTDTVYKIERAMMGDIDKGGFAYAGARGTWKNLCTFLLIFCEPKITL